MKGFRGFKATAIIFYGYCAVTMVLCIVSLVSAITFVNKGFPGFLVYPFPNVGASGSRDWPGYAAGLKFMDRIVSMDGEPVRNGQQVVNWTIQKSNGTPVHYVIESKGVTRGVTIPVHTFGIKDFLIVFVVPFIFGLAVYALGFIVYVLKPNVHSSWIFLIVCFSLGTFVGTGFEIQSSYHLVYIHYLIIPLVPAAVFHLFSIFPDRKKVLNRHPLLEYAIYIPAALIAAAYLVFLFTYQDGDAMSWIPHPKLTTPVNRIFFLFGIFSAVVFLIHSLAKALESVARQRARVMLFGIGVAFLPSVTITAVVTFLKVSFPWNFLVVFLVFFPASIAYSIIRHNLFDADAIIKRTVGYVVVTGIIVGAYVVLSIGLNVFLGKYELAQSRAFPIFFTVAIIFLINPLRDRIQRIVDRLFFRKEYDYGEIVNKISAAITSLMDLGQVLNRLTRTFIEDMFINTTSVMLLNPATAEYQVYVVEGEGRSEIEGRRFGRDEPLIRIIEEEKKELTRNDVLEDPKHKEVCQQCAKNFDSLHATLMVPLVFKDSVIGLMSLGEKKSGKSFNREDINLLHSVANQGAVAIENARLFKENLDKQRMEEELAIARDLQLSMLPASCPQMEGVEIAARSTPAREVGGDFFDFIEMEEGNIGFVVGDVTGKSVSGALVMSSSRSVFRMLSEAELNVGEIMTRANRRMKQDLKSGMFVALLYAVLDSKTRVLSLCSAGQTQPIHFSSETGKAMLVQTEGDTFPIGILDEAEYKETLLPLAPGDTLVFYTDGIVEATNEQGEMFGFERLLGLVQEARSTNADWLLKEILEKVSAFVGVAPQHDDLTAIAVSVSG